MFRTVSSLFALFMLASTSFAHEGHGHPAHQDGAMHYLVNPSHAAPIVSAVAAVIGVCILIRRVRRI